MTTPETKDAASVDPLVEYVRRSLDLDDPTELEKRAEHVASLGYGRTATHMREQAELLRVEKEAGKAATHRSPIPEATDEQWTGFVKLMQTGATDALTPAGQLGLFGTRMKRLADLGIATEVRRTPATGGAAEQPGWTATLKPPLSFDRLRADPLLQYRVFVASMKRYRDDILGLHREAIGKEIEGRKATLSGLLAVAHHAGPGLASWLTNDKDRRRFAKTTAAYVRTTGVF